MGSDRVQVERKSSSTLTPGFKHKQFSFLQPRYQDTVETDSVQEDKQQNSTDQSNPTPPFLGHSFGRVSVRPIQAKLTIGQPGDKYEQEADRVAAQVVQQVNSPQPQQSGGIQRDAVNPEDDKSLQTKPAISTLQRETMPEEEEEEKKLQTKSLLQRQEIPEEEEEELQMKPVGNSIQRQEMPEEEEKELQAKPIAGRLQRESLPEEEEEMVRAKRSPTTIQREALPEQEEEELQTKFMLQQQAEGSGVASAGMEASIKRAQGQGQPLGDEVRGPMEQAFGSDFSGVRVHTDAQSDQLNKSIQARAFTTGQDVFFRQGEYQPENRSGQELLVHELTHVVQQTNGQIPSAKAKAMELSEGMGGAKKRTDMPSPQRTSLEQPLGMELSGVRVHKNSPKSSQLNALAYTQGQDIHAGSGQEKHLLHEGWHAVQQMQGRVKPTMQAKGVPINDDAGLEREADVMGAKASWGVGEDRQRSRREVVGIAPTNQPTVQRSVTGEGPLPGGGVTAPTKWRVKMTGVAKMTGSGPARTKPIADTVIFDPGPAKMVTLSGILTFKQYEYGKSWRWGDPKWRRRSMDIPFDYSAHFTGTNKNGTAQVKFSSDTKRKLELKFPKLGSNLLYEIEPSASGDTGLIKAKAFHSSHTMEVSTAIKLQPTKKEPEIEIGPIYIEREVTIDNFPRSKATVSPQNFKKIEDFWLSLTPETRKAIQDDKMLNGRKVQITGYTSNTDKVTNNFELGHKRAMAVRDILMKLSGNVVGTNLAPISKHERPIFTDDPKKEKEDAKHRKVKIMLWQLPSPE